MIFNSIGGGSTPEYTTILAIYELSGGSTTKTASCNLADYTYYILCGYVRQSSSTNNKATTYDSKIIYTRELNEILSKMSTSRKREFPDIVTNLDMEVSANGATITFTSKVEGTSSSSSSAYVIGVR